MSKIPTLKEALHLWTSRKARSVCPGTAEQVYRLSVGWRSALGDGLLVSALRTEHVEKIEEARDDGERSGSALNQERTYLRQFCRWALEHDWLDKDPTRTWKKRREDVRREYATLSREEEERFLAAAPEWLRRFVLVAICTGFREGTIRGLTWTMLDEEAAEFQIPGAIVKQRRPLVMPVAPRLLEALRPRGAGLLLPGLPPAARLWQIFKEVGRAAGINPASSPHDLRRTWVERMILGGADIGTIMKLAGWKSMSVLLKHYIDRVPRERAAELILKV